ncbi:MAG: hypothetical protein WB819_10190 [Terriglobia bacterium]
MRRTFILLLALVAAVPIEARAASTCDTAIGRIDGINFGGKKVDVAPRDAINLKRADESMQVSNGLPVCAGDLISTAQNTQLTVRMGNNAEQENEITIYGGSTVELSASDSLLMKLGRLFAFLRHPFTANTVFGSLGARGTAFELEATADHATLEQLEGSVEFNPQVSRLLLPGWGKTRPGLVRVSFLYVRGQISASAPGPEAETDPPARIPRLTRLTFGPHQAGSTQQLSVKTCEAWVQRNSEAIVATRPEFPSQPVATGIENVSGRYENARKQAICAESANALQDLAEVYAAWNQAGDAVHALDKARAAGQLRSASPIALNNMGNAYRLAGDLKTAGRFYEEALKRDSAFAFPYNGLGDVFRDEALMVYAQSKGDNVADVRANLEKARRYYRQSLSSGVWGKAAGTTNRAIALYNLGDVNLLLAIVQPDNADPLLKEADRLFTEAGQQSNFPFADVGLARVQLTRAQLVRPRAVPSGLGALKTMAEIMAETVRVGLERKPYLKRAADILNRALQRYPNFSAAAETMGEVVQVRGNPRSAAKSYLRAIEMDPHNAVAYLQYSKTVGNHNESRVYAQVSRQIEPPARTAINNGRMKISNPPEPKPQPQPEERGEQHGHPTIKARASVKPTAVHFSRPGTASVLLTNSGPGPLVVQSVRLEGANMNSFLITNNGCAGQSLPVHRNCSVKLEFKPKAEGTHGATLLIFHNGSNSPARVPLSSGRIVM